MSNNGLGSLIKKPNYGVVRKEENTFSASLPFDVKKGDFLYKKENGGEELYKLYLANHENDVQEYSSKAFGSAGGFTVLFNDETNEAFSLGLGAFGSTAAIGNSINNFNYFSFSESDITTTRLATKNNSFISDKPNNIIAFVSETTELPAKYTLSQVDPEYQLVSNINTAVDVRIGNFTAFVDFVNLDLSKGYIFAYSDALHSTKFRIYNSQFVQNIEVAVHNQSILDGTLSLTVNPDEKTFLISWIDNATKYLKYAIYDFAGNVVSALKDLEAIQIQIDTFFRSYEKYCQFSAYDNTFVIFGFDGDKSNSRFYKIDKTGKMILKTVTYTEVSPFPNLSVDKNKGLILTTNGSGNFKLFSSDGIIIKNESYQVDKNLYKKNIVSIISNFDNSSEFIVGFYTDITEDLAVYRKYSGDGLFLDQHMSDSYTKSFFEPSKIAYSKKQIISLY